MKNKTIVLLLIVIAIVPNADAEGIYIGTENPNTIVLKFLAVIIGIVALLGVLYMFHLMTKSTIEALQNNSKKKRKVIVKGGQRMANCPVCDCLLEVFDKSDGNCPDCKTHIEILYEG